ncbi:MAG: hypothetical protein LUO93_06290 [Methanomicrobiales archaeon]|nr:hypothetical protein [Methanomicrobiales archaeon]
MSEDTKKPAREPVDIPKKQKTRADKQQDHMDRIKRTLTASFLGIAAGVIAFFLQDDPTTGFLLVLIAIIIQRYLFIPLRRGREPLGAKDWIYQGFMTVSFWFITWTILLTTSAPLP